jgi:hypothetical protein
MEWTAQAGCQAWALWPQAEYGLTLFLFFKFIIPLFIPEII